MSHRDLLASGRVGARGVLALGAAALAFSFAVSGAALAQDKAKDAKPAAAALPATQPLPASRAPG